LIQFRLDEIQDPIVRENFQKILEQFRTVPYLKGKWQFAELEFTAAATNFKFQHRLGFRPKDVILTSKTGSATVTFNYDSFTNTHIDITVSAATTIRFFFGLYFEG